MKTTLIIQPSDMKRNDLNGAEIIEDVLKRTTGEEWTVSTYSMCAGSSVIIDVPDNIRDWITKYDGGMIVRKMEHRLLTNIPSEVFKKSPDAPQFPEFKETDGKKWKLVFEFPYK